MRLEPPTSVRTLQRKLYRKAKLEPTCGASTATGCEPTRPSRTPCCTGGWGSTGCQRGRRGSLRRMLCGEGDRRVPPTAGFDEGVLGLGHGWASEAPPDERGGNR